MCVPTLACVRAIVSRTPLTARVSVVPPFVQRDGNIGIFYTSRKRETRRRKKGVGGLI